MKVLILAGGLGAGLRPLTDNVAKPMVRVRGKPVLEWNVQQLVKQGFRDITIAVAYKKEQITSYFGEGKRFGCRITYLQSRESQESLYPVLQFCRKGEPFMVVLASRLNPGLDYRALVREHAGNVKKGFLVTGVWSQQFPERMVDAKGRTLLAERKGRSLVARGFLKVSGSEARGWSKLVDHSFSFSAIAGVGAGVWVMEPTAVKHINVRALHAVDEFFTRLGDELALFLYAGKAFNVDSLENAVLANAFISGRPTTPDEVDLAVNNAGYINRHRRVVTVDGVIEKDGKVLLVRRSKRVEIGKLALPGGFVEPFETIEKACEREVLEETGLRVRVVRLVGVYSEPKRDPDWRKGIHPVACVFECRLLGGKLHHQPGETSEAGWFAYSELRQQDIAFDHYEILKEYFTQKGRS